jgi:Tol biopolymer transport system component
MRSAALPPMLTYITGLGTSNPANVVVAGVNGASPSTLGRANSALLRPDGTQVAAIEKGSTSSWTLLLYSSTAGTAPTKLYTSPKFIQLLAWSPDSRYLLVGVGATAAGVLSVFDTATKAHMQIAGGAFYGASFQPGSSDRLVYARADHSGVDLYTTSASGSNTAQLTHGGSNEYPVWGPNGIVYDRATAHKGSSSPQFQLYLTRPGGATTQLTSAAIPSGLWGLTPVAFSASGTHLLANFVGQNTTEAYVIDLSAKKVTPRDLTGAGNGTIGDAISRRGDMLLVTKGRTDSQAADSVETIPWSGGKPAVIAVHGAYASWND